MPPITPLLQAARTGDLSAFARLVAATQDMAFAVAWQVLHDRAEARDAVQDAYLTAFRRLGVLNDPEAFAGWLRRIVVTSALNRRRRQRAQWVPLQEDTSPPLLDDEESRWTEHQQRLLSRALLTLTAEERRLCELHYHGGVGAERLATMRGCPAGHDPQAAAAHPGQVAKGDRDGRATDPGHPRAAR